MDLQTISQVSKTYHVSTRTLRYYEQIGLLQSIKKDEYAYRTYDEMSLLRLQQIIILRRLRIPLKQIGHILQSEDITIAIKVFQSNILEIQDEISALSTIKSILQSFINRINSNLTDKVHIDLIEDESMLKLVETLKISNANFKEEKSMENLNEADANLAKLKDVRIVYLPPATVISSHNIGTNPEEDSSRPLDQFIRNSGLCETKPDLRHFGFNHPSPSDDRHDHGYERWVTIPDTMEIPKPFVKKHFNGGLYAAHMIPIGAFDEWNWFFNWVKQSDKYEMNLGEDECMSGCLEEHLNYVNYVRRPEGQPYELQLDLLIPIKEKETI